MKHIKFLFLVCFVFAGANAHANRWILKNPQSIARSLTVVKEITFNTGNYVVVEGPDQLSTLDGLVQADSVVEDLKIEIPKLAKEAQKSDAWHVKDLKYDQIPKGITGKGIIVAILDTGMDYHHEALANHIWKNEKEIPNNGIDDDKNGYIDDVVGYDFDSKSGDPYHEYESHATHCAGIVGADKQKDGEARGIAQGAKIMAVRIIGDDSGGFLSNAAEGIKYAVDNGAKVLSNSWRVYKSWEVYGTTPEHVQLLWDAIKYAETKGVIFVNAAGNENADITILSDPIYPSGFTGLSNLVVVAATDQTGEISDFSNFGVPNVMVAAPGTDIISTIPGGEWTDMSGTSMATPMVAGALALGLSNGFSPEEAINKLIKSSSVKKSFQNKVLSNGIISPVEYLK